MRTSFALDSGYGTDMHSKFGKSTVTQVKLFKKINLSSTINHEINNK